MTKRLSETDKEIDRAVKNAMRRYEPDFKNLVEDVVGIIRQMEAEEAEERRRRRQRKKKTRRTSITDPAPKKRGSGR